MGRIIYMPLEGYRERYTWQWSAPKTGWLERNWIKAGIDYVRIDPAVETDGSAKPPTTIKTGSVVDGVGRSVYCFNQIKMLLRMAERGEVTSDDVIYFDDFWTPGIEALPYAFHLLGIKPKMYAFLHAQSVDKYDFTHPMAKWIRPFEQAIANCLDGIFVCCPTLKKLVTGEVNETGNVLGCSPGIAIGTNMDLVHVTGHPFNSEEVMGRMPEWYRVMMQEERLSKLIDTECYKPFPKRKNQVVWSSRWDPEKNPEFFLKVAKLAFDKKLDAKFVVCTSAPKLRSSDQKQLDNLRDYMHLFPNVELRENLTKEEYYAVLCESKIQFNSASQDFVAITLLEASVAGCYPVYPNFRSFPETFQHQHEFMYEHLDVNDAYDAIETVIGSKTDDLFTPANIKERAWIHTRFDDSWKRMLNVMVGSPMYDAPKGDELWGSRQKS
jgi:glycosyltransferase involved in cell wall biosynthesis